ncbi:hypothetical protein [Komagataeibacter swingsii]|nr:hypothetical protein [Komagataeibacter swingsii]
MPEIRLQTGLRITREFLVSFFQKSGVLSKLLQKASLKTSFNFKALS